MDRTGSSRPWRIAAGISIVVALGAAVAVGRSAFAPNEEQQGLPDTPSIAGTPVPGETSATKEEVPESARRILDNPYLQNWRRSLHEGISAEIHSWDPYYKFGITRPREGMYTRTLPSPEGEVLRSSRSHLLQYDREARWQSLVAVKDSNGVIVDRWANLALVETEVGIEEFDGIGFAKVGTGFLIDITALKDRVGNYIGIIFAPEQPIVDYELMEPKITVWPKPQQ